MSISKERREELRENMRMNPRAVEPCDMPGQGEVLELLETADERDSLEEDRDDWVGEYNYQMHRYDALFDEAENIRIERDRYRALLERAKAYVPGGRALDKDIDAALEGKTND